MTFHFVVLSAQWTGIFLVYFIVVEGGFLIWEALKAAAE